MKKELVINPYAPEGFYDEKIVLNRQGELIKIYVISPKSKPSVLFNDRYSLKKLKSL